MASSDLFLVEAELNRRRAEQLRRIAPSISLKAHRQAMLDQAARMEDEARSLEGMRPASAADNTGC